MSDDLPERIYQAAFDRNVIIDRTDCAALAAAARAFIGDEINADMEDTRKIWRDGKPLYDGCTHWEEGYGDGYEDSESIARGDTK
jgi:hypothetical protein